MTNREWLQKMALIDLLNYFIHNSDQCVLCMLGNKTYIEHCDKFYDSIKSLDDTCYDCVASWLNEEK